MTNIDVISDMLTRIRNSIKIKAKSVKIIRTTITLRIAEILRNEGFIESFEELGESYLTKDGFVHKYIYITLKYKGEKRISFINNLKRVSRPGLRIYVGYKDIHKLVGNLGLAVLSTPKGLMTDKSCKINKVGGELLFYIW